MTAGLVGILTLVALALAVGSCIRWWTLRPAMLGGANEAIQAAQLRLASLRVWWLLLFLFSAALLAGKPGLSLLFGVASLIGIREFHRIFGRQAYDSVGLVRLISLLAIVHYALLVWFAPAWLLPASTGGLLLAIIVQQLWAGNTQNYVRTTGGYLWAAMVIVVGLSCSVALTDLPVARHPWNAGVVGWTLFLVLLTETSDISQALVGRKFGHHKMIPRVSPGKTWEGLVGGILFTSLLALLLSGPLTTFFHGRSTWQGVVVAWLCGVVVSLAGLVGDLNISALKREAGLKDSSQLFPGMGGMLDRLDSLTFTAPTLYCYALLATPDHS